MMICLFISNLSEAAHSMSTLRMRDTYGASHQKNTAARLSSPQSALATGEARVRRCRKGNKNPGNVLRVTAACNQACFGENACPPYQDPRTVRPFTDGLRGLALSMTPGRTFIAKAMASRILRALFHSQKQHPVRRHGKRTSSENGARARREPSVPKTCSNEPHALHMNTKHFSYSCSPCTKAYVGPRTSHPRGTRRAAAKPASVNEHRAANPRTPTGRRAGAQAFHAGYPQPPSRIPVRSAREPKRACCKAVIQSPSRRCRTT